MSGTNVKGTAKHTSQGQGHSLCAIAHLHPPIIISCTVHTQHLLTTTTHYSSAEPTTHLLLFVHQDIVAAVNQLFLQQA